MAEPISIQQLKDASEDAITLADFIYKPANVMIPRRLAADINSLQYYLDYMSSYAQHSYETYDEMVANAPNLPDGVSAFVTNDLDTTKNGIYTYNGTSFVKGEYQPENAAKDFVEAKLGGLEVFDGKVRAQDVSTVDGSTQAVKNLEFRNDIDALPFEGGVLADTFVTATANGVGAVPRNLRDVNSDTVNLLNFGGKSEVGFDNSTAFANALKTGKKVMVTGKDAVYEVHNKVPYTKDLRISFEDGSGIKAVSLTNKTFVFDVSGELTNTTNLSVAAVKGKDSIQVVDASALKPNDVITLYNRVQNSFNDVPARTTYMASEFAVVREVVGNEVFLQGVLYDSYAVADTDIYKLNPIAVELDNPKISCDGSFFGLIKTSNTRELIINNPRLINKSNNCIGIFADYGGEVNGGSIVNMGTTGDDYGIVIGQSQHTRLNGGYRFGRRHGITIGNNGVAGSAVCRDVLVNGATISNDPNSGTHSADIHGNNELCAYINCNITRGINYQGKNHTIKDNIITSFGAGICVNFAEVLGGEAKITGNTLIVNSDPVLSQYGIVNCKALRSNAKEDLTITFTGNTVVSDVLSAATDIVLIENNGSTHKINVRCEGNELKVNALRGVVYMRRITGVVASDYIIVDNNTLPTGISAYSLAPSSAGYSQLNCLKLQSNYWSDTATLVSNRDRVDTSIKNFKWKYPIAPSVQSSISGVSGQTFTDLVTTLNLYVATDRAQLSVVPLNKTTFESTNTVNVSARAYVDNIS